MVFSMIFHRLLRRAALSAEQAGKTCPKVSPVNDLERQLLSINVNVSVSRQKRRQVASYNLRTI